MNQNSVLPFISHFQLKELKEHKKILDLIAPTGGQGAGPFISLLLLHEANAQVLLHYPEKLTLLLLWQGANRMLQLM